MEKCRLNTTFLLTQCSAMDVEVMMAKYLYKCIFGETHRCSAYECSQGKDLNFCGDCDEFPCDNLHPYADKASDLPHNIKVFNLCLINKMGLEKWAKTKASEVRKIYFNKPWTLT